ncbi:hypothetical protein V1477_013999 [Vespula maculifrons]|uniref:Uncharacterized protein n=1 Tax=Vespula maculifrons TaxID=7453 RepID=A0ABD2BLB0_VESMC
MEGYGGLERQLDFSTALENRKRVRSLGAVAGNNEHPVLLSFSSRKPPNVLDFFSVRNIGTGFCSASHGQDCNYPHDYKEEEEEEEEEEEVADGGSCGGSYGGGGADGGGGGGGGGCSSSLYSTLNRSLRVSGYIRVPRGPKRIPRQRIIWQNGYYLSSTLRAVMPTNLNTLK